MHRLPDLTALPSRLLALCLALFVAHSAPEIALAKTAAEPLATAAAALCDGPDCTVRFSFSTTSAVWRVPVGSGNFRIELAGASGGGDLGGSGALISASLNLSAGQLLEVRLGGAGKRGDAAAGGFNGGGNAGFGMGRAGSGGGMSQLFLDSAGSSPILVAGGGGGAGGGAGVAGGSAGWVGEQGSNGKNSTGGGGAQANRGGSAGQSGDVDVEPTPGQSGLGGVGASLRLGAAGGGGGAGFFGGGGGGTAFENCCRPGSGGGGGSSFADTRYVASPQLSLAPNGSGYAIIKYQLLPTVVSHNWQQLSANSGEIQLTFNLPIVAMHAHKISLAGCGQFASSPMGSLPANSWRMRLTDCVNGKPQIRLAAGALESLASGGTPILGPATEYAIEFDLSVSPAKLKLQSAGAFATSEVRVLLSSESKISGLKSSSLSAPGCDGIEVKSVQVGYQLNLRGCKDGRHTLRLAAGSVTDSRGVASPNSDMNLTFRVDLVAPSATLKLLEMDHNANLAEIELFVSEAVTDPLEALQTQLQRSGCEGQWREISANRFVGRVGCDSQVVLSLAANSLTDGVGRTGPATDILLRLDFRANPGDESDSAVAIPPWIAIGESPQPPVSPSDLPEAVAEGPDSGEQQSNWLNLDSSIIRLLGIVLLVAVLALVGLMGIRATRGKREKKTPKSAEDDSSVAINKYPVFGKPAHRLG